MPKVKTSKRPIIIWVISILVFLAFVLNVPLAVIGQSLYGNFYAFFLVFVSVVNLFSFVGVFMMKKWGAQLFAWIFIVSQAIMLFENWWTPFNFVVSFVLIVILTIYYKRMN